MQSWNTTHMETEIRDRSHITIIHQIEHNETVIKSKYENTYSPENLVEWSLRWEKVKKDSD